MAEKLFLSTFTIDTHRNNIIKKIEVKNTAELVKFAIEQNLD
ncbi:response regulator transcription factor [Pedobacter sp. SD-b]|uniref:Response regulator transcription factor n=1 Tax=Pedobacter segetis TaxID=2793069 RepID=A0ABS1BIJ4_9SPHI|nr:response regulator transcription factor [Pedobacter segetis]